ncbi:TPA: hypothetical protein CPT79_01680 [Candidatus Gastranaerophilales bacterium HUM_6]|nr:unknown [Fusobacterium sp. CAG:815]DAA93164.1 MAG TPA: hypothetical protein CPT79_01680 [Candidatus Gastranaerophilales bacterium HUM_6]DAA93571.1 MAG TPA: hypothetical protein CPT93_03795 [Candidatus Gastranaerophilales bacterium HUM_7]DAB01885.1 MAG TPA: hypothetical protein CPT84_06495 [Candidatus Gastranaerophilales bacterium HUM_12]DAB06485.1 MAG TPA: hypothetical protein CPT78_04840 [Candidatus Gastranaerophilales bacterium HUM_14]
MSDKLKKLTGKNPKDFEPVAFDVINIPDVELFKELIDNEDFLFDFIKQNVANRLAKVCNSSNYLNLLQFLKYYSPSYEDVIISNLVKFSDEDLTDKMLAIFEDGTDDEKTYCAKYFSIVQDSLALDFLKENAYSENSSLSANCATALALFGDTESKNEALVKLKSDDEFEKLDGVRFLVSYDDKSVIPAIVDVMKTSSFAENIAGDLLYLTDLFSLYKTNKTDALFVFNSVINGLGEILDLAQIFDFRLYEFIEMLLKEQTDSEIAVVLANAKDKFNTLTENDEYLFDETKDVKQEVMDIKQLLSSFKVNQSLINAELKSESLFVFTALEFANNESAIRGLLISANQTVVLKALEMLKQMNSLTKEDKNLALSSVTSEDIKSVIVAI